MTNDDESATVGRMPQTELGRLIEERMAAKGWVHLTQLARAADVSHSALRTWIAHEGGEVRPQQRTLNKVARALGVPASVMQAAAGYRVEPLDTSNDPDFDVLVAVYRDRRERSPEEAKRLLRIALAAFDAAFPPEPKP